MSKITVFNPLNLPVGSPTNGTEATNKTYVDTLLATKIPTTGGAFSGMVKTIPIELTPTASHFSLDTSLSNTFVIQLTASGTLDNPINTSSPVVTSEGQIIHLLVKNTGAFTLTFDTNYWFPGGTNPTITSGVDKYDLIVLVGSPLSPTTFLCYAYQNLQ